MIDAHLHPPRLADVHGQIEAAAALGVTAFVMGGIDKADWAAQRALRAADPRLLPCFGLHPAVVHGPQALDDLDAALDAGRPVALGELGLDRRVGPFEDQLPLLRAQLDRARSLDLPVVLHLVGGWEPFFDTLRRDGPLPAGGFVHAFSGSPPLAQALHKAGLGLSFGGALTRSPRTQAAARALPAEALLIETDAPDQPPQRPPGAPIGAPCRPVDLAVIASALAALRGVAPADLAATTAANTRRILRLTEPRP